jgi:hypothetical protein
MRLLASLTATVVFLACAGEGEYAFDMGAPMGVDGGLPPVVSGDGGDAPRPRAEAGLPPVGDAFVPPMNMRVDAGPVLSTPEALQMCVFEMSNVIHGSYFAAGCNDYTDEEKADFDSPYHREPVMAACIKLSCEMVVVEGHNGIPATRSCRELQDLRLILDNAATEAVAGNCDLPIYQMRLLTLDEFVGLEPCDGYTCGIDEEGNPIAIDNRM